jgi:hypothetical protein
MATLKIKEYEKTVQGSFGEALGIFDEETASYQSAVTFTAGSVAGQSAAFTNQWVVLQADSVCYVAFGVNPTATVAGFLKLAADERVGFRVKPGWKVSVI